MKICPFCHFEKNRVVVENSLTVTFRDAYPLSQGHCLITPKRHIASFFETSETEQIALLRALQQVKEYLDEEYHPAGYNIGINEGAAAGQTIFHLHLHIIPRYPGDCVDPRGGIRWIFPEKAVYWK